MKKITLPNEVYDVLKWICIIVFPAIEVFIGTIGTIWKLNLPIKEIVETLAAAHVLLGTVLGISCYNYNKDNTEG